MVRTKGQNILKFLHAVDFLKNAIFKCELRLLEPLKQNLWFHHHCYRQPDLAG